MFVLITDATCKRLLTGAILTLNLAQKSFETGTKPRRPPKCHKTGKGSSGASTSKESSQVYKHLNGFKHSDAAVNLTG